MMHNNKMYSGHDLRACYLGASSRLKAQKSEMYGCGRGFLLCSRCWLLHGSGDMSTGSCVEASIALRHA